MRTSLRFQHKFAQSLPVSLKNQDIRLSEDFLEYFIDQYSEPGDSVFDPFAGFGTTLSVAERMGRQGFGVEVDATRHQYGVSQLDNPDNFLLSDIRSIDLGCFPEFKLSISSPIYMHEDEDRNPLSGFEEPGNYKDYLKDLTDIYLNLAKRLLPGGLLLIEAANLKSDRGVTTFAWDLCNALRLALPFQGEVTIHWDQYGYGYDHSYCLIFGRPD